MPAIDQLKRVVQATANLEHFAREVCNVVFGEGARHSGGANTGNRRRYSPKDVPRVLRGWVQDLDVAQRLQEFVVMVARSPTAPPPHRCKRPALQAPSAAHLSRSGDILRNRWFNWMSVRATLSSRFV